ncbi:hypothetical protein PS6_004292 [Mucor atramentarius]
MILEPLKKLKPVPDDPNNYCCICDIACHTRVLYAENYRSTHQSVSLTGSNANMRTKPKLNDASNHCCSCDRQFASKTLYRKYLTFRLKMNIMQSPNILPDWHDANYHCRSCELQFTSAKVYHEHYQNVHRITSQGMLQPKTQVPDLDDYNFYSRKEPIKGIVAKFII